MSWSARRFASAVRSDPNRATFSPHTGLAPCSGLYVAVDGGFDKMQRNDRVVVGFRKLTKYSHTKLIRIRTILIAHFLDEVGAYGFRFGAADFHRTPAVGVFMERIKEVPRSPGRVATHDNLSARGRQRAWPTSKIMSGMPLASSSKNNMLVEWKPATLPAGRAATSPLPRTSPAHRGALFYQRETLVVP